MPCVALPLSNQKAPIIAYLFSACLHLTFVDLATFSTSNELNLQCICLWVVINVSNSDLDVSQSVGAAVCSVSEPYFHYLLCNSKIDSPPWPILFVSMRT